MDQGEALEAELPPHRDDEPPALRRDIIDELADHLECSFRHELLRNRDPETARARALERFGDPAALARRLWFDAMKGKIMKQRLLIAGGVVVVLASVAVAGLAWQSSMNAWRQAERALRAAEVEKAQALAGALADSQAANQQMLSRLNEMAESLKHPRSPDWNPVKVVLTDETTEGAPVKDVSITLTGSTDVAELRTDSDGVADFGLRHPGSYQLMLLRALPASIIRGELRLSVGAAKEVVERISCPRPPERKAAVKVVCHWPREFEKERLYLYVVFVPSAREQPSGDDRSPAWSLLGPAPKGLPRSQLKQYLMSTMSNEFQAVLMGTDGSTIVFREDRAPAPWNWGVNRLEGLSMDVADADRLTSGSTPAKWWCWPHRVSALLVLKPNDPKDPPPGQRGRHSYKVITGVAGAFQSPAVPILYHTSMIQPGSPNDETMSQPFFLHGNDGIVPFSSFKQVLAPPFDSPTRETRFEPSLDHPNEWTIPFPEELAQELRKALKKPSPQ